MAVFNLAINYPDGEGARIMTALKSHYGVATNAEAIEMFRKLEVVARVRTIVLHEERKAALATVAETNPS